MIQENGNDTTALAPYSRQCYHMVTRPPFCVYTHSYQSTVFYVGQGWLGRPFDGNMRNSRWKHYVKQLPTYTITILDYFSTRQEAQSAEKHYIAVYQPFCNLDYRGVHIIVDALSSENTDADTPLTANDRHLVAMALRIQELEAQCHQLEHALQQALQEARLTAQAPHTQRESWWKRLLRK